MMWLLVYTIIAFGEIKHEYSWHKTMGDCFEVRDDKIEEKGRPIIDYQLQCIPVTEENYEKFRTLPGMPKYDPEFVQHQL